MDMGIERPLKQLNAICCRTGHAIYRCQIGRLMDRGDLFGMSRTDPSSLSGVRFVKVNHKFCGIRFRNTGAVLLYLPVCFSGIFDVCHVAFDEGE